MIINKYNLNLLKVRKLLFIERIFYYALIIVLVLLLFMTGIYPLLKGAEYNPNGNVPWWFFLIYLVVELSLIILSFRLYKIIHKFSLFINFSIDEFKNSHVIIHNNYLTIIHNYKSFKFELKELTVTNYIFNGNYKHPLKLHGFVKITDMKSSNNLLLSSLVFDYFAGSNKAKDIFKNSVKYNELTLSWIKFNLDNLP